RHPDRSLSHRNDPSFSHTGNTVSSALIQKVLASRRIVRVAPEAASPRLRSIHVCVRFWASYTTCRLSGVQPTRTTRWSAGGYFAVSIHVGEPVRTCTTPILTSGFGSPAFG